MKLYTEEQIREAMFELTLYPYDNGVDKILENLTPVELPNDEEIENGMNKRLFLSDKHLQFNAGTKAGFKLGAKWMKEQILNQNK